MKFLDFDFFWGLLMLLYYEIEDCDGYFVEFFEILDYIYNKKNFCYMYCIVDLKFLFMLYYRLIEFELYGLWMSFEDIVMYIFFDKFGKWFIMIKGFRMVCVNVVVWEGRWYWECKIINGIWKMKDGEVKIEGGKYVWVGWVWWEVLLDVFVGFDVYSYGICDVFGEKVYMLRLKEFFLVGEGICEGDVIGFEI